MVGPMMIMGMVGAMTMAMGYAAAKDKKKRDEKRKKDLAFAAMRAEAVRNSYNTRPMGTQLYRPAMNHDNRHRLANLGRAYYGDIYDLDYFIK